MPAEHPADPIWRELVATQLTRSSKAALEASRELLAHYGETGDPSTQQALDTLVDRAAEALTTLGESLAASSQTLGPETFRSATA